MSALRVLVAKPLDRVLDLDDALPFSQNHFTGVRPDAEFEALAPIARSCTRTSRSTMAADFSPRYFRSTSVTIVARL